MHPSIANLSTRLQICTGDIPPPFVGASVTLVEPSPYLDDKSAKIYLFGGRLVSNRRMVNSFYRLDVDEMRWTKFTPWVRTNPSASGADADSKTQPHPRYFHSADVWRDKIIFFGGMGYTKKDPDSEIPKSPTEAKGDDLCVLDEILVFDLNTQTWDCTFYPQAASTATDDDHVESLKPAPRYAHLSSITADSLVIVGGQNMTNQYVESINIFNLAQRQWIGSQRFKKQCGSYRSLAVGGRLDFRQGEKAKCYPRGRDPLNSADDDTSDPNHSNFSSNAKVEQNPLSTSVVPSSGSPLPVYLYSNYNFTDVRRELELLHVKGESDTKAKAAFGGNRHRRDSNASQESALDGEMPISAASEADACHLSGPYVSIQDRSSDMSGSTFPPGLRFPTGAVLGSYLIISGTYLANATQTFSIWALHLPSLTWSRIEGGTCLSSGSWNRAVLWPRRNRLVVFGNRERDLVSDYNHRQTNWDHVVILELEAWGIYQPPVSKLSDSAVQLGLDMLAASAPTAIAQASGRQLLALDQLKPLSSSDDSDTRDAQVGDLLRGRGDFEIICSDGLRIGCDKAVLESRWPWFKEQMDEYQKKAKRTARVVSLSSSEHGLGIIPEDLSDILQEEYVELIEPAVADVAHESAAVQKVRDPRFQPRHITLSEPAPVVLAFLQFLYAQRIGTSLQRHPAVVCALLVLAKTYSLDNLTEWAKHAAHVALADDLNPKPPSVGTRLSGNVSSSQTNHTPNDNASSLELFRPTDSLGLHPEERHRLAVCLYEAASLCGCEGLQIRALRVVMAIARWLQKHGAGGSGQGSAGSNDRSTFSHTTPGSGGPAGGANPRSFSGGPLGSQFGAGGSSSSAMPPPPAPNSKGASTQAHSSTAPIQQGLGRIDTSAGSQPSVSQAPAQPPTPTSPPRISAEQTNGRPRDGSVSSSEDPNRLSSLSYLYDVYGHASFFQSSTWQDTEKKRSSMVGRTPTAADSLPDTHRLESSSTANLGTDRSSMEEPTNPNASASLEAALVCLVGRNELNPQSYGSPHAPTNSFHGYDSAASKRSAIHRLATGDSLPGTSAASPYSVASPRSLVSQASFQASPNVDSPVMGTNNGYFSESFSTSASASQHSLATPPSPQTGFYSSQPPFGRPSTNESVRYHDLDLVSTNSTEVSKSTSNKSLKEIQKMEKKRAEQEEKERKKAEKAEAKRLAAEAVFGNKASNVLGSPSPENQSPPSSASSRTIPRFSDTISDGSSVRSGTSTASPRSSSIRTNQSGSKTPNTLIQSSGEWTVSNKTGQAAWFGGPPPPMYNKPSTLGVKNRKIR